jgi:hypothetical protein
MLRGWSVLVVRRETELVSAFLADQQGLNDIPPNVLEAKGTKHAFYSNLILFGYLGFPYLTCFIQGL